MKTKSFLFAIILLITGIAQAQNSKNSGLTVSISGKNSGEITLGEIIGQNLLVSNDTYKVSSFTVEISTTETNSYQVEGMTFNKQVSGKIRTAPVGTVIHLKNIKAVNENNKTIDLPEMLFTLKR